MNKLETNHTTVTYESPLSNVHHISSPKNSFSSTHILDRYYHILESLGELGHPPLKAAGFH